MNNFKVIITSSEKQLNIDRKTALYNLYSGKFAYLKRDVALKLTNNDYSRIFVISGVLGLLPISFKTLPHDPKFIRLFDIKNKIYNQYKKYFTVKDIIFFIGSKKYGEWLKKNLFPKLTYIPYLEEAKEITEYEIRLEKYLNRLSPNPRDFLIFHSLRSYNLSQLAELCKNRKEGKLIAPSIGITKIVKVAKRFVDIILLMKYDTLMNLNYPIYDRDIWSPKISMIPDQIYHFNPTDKVKEILDSWIIKQMKDKWDKLYPGTKNKDSFSRFIVMEYFYDIIYELYDTKYKDIFEDEVEFLHYIIDNLVQEKTKSLENMVTYLKENYKELRGQDAFAYAYAYAARKVPQNKLLEQINQKLINEGSKVNFEAIKKKQWELLSLLEGRERSIMMDVQELGGELLRGGTFNHFKEIFYKGWYRLDPEKTIETLEENGLTLEKYYKLLKKWIVDIKSEYFEAKTLDLVSINDFYIALVSEKNFKEDIRLLEDVMKFKGIIMIYNNDSIDNILNNNKIKNTFVIQK
jgi:hypothetical protein